MRAVRFREFGGPEVMEVVDVAEPHTPRGHVRITVKAAGVNGIDWKIRAGLLQDQMPIDLPAGTGRDAAGVVEEIGDDVDGIAIGDPVFGSGSQTLAEKAVLHSWALKPDALSFEEAAGLPVPVETALRILDQVGVAPGQTLLISGAAGGVGSAAVQIARSRGVTVIGTASRGNQDYVASLGAVATTYGPGLVDRVRELARHGVDAALDVAGSGVIAELIELTGEPGKVVSIADFSAVEHGAQISTQTGDFAAACRSAAQLVTEGKLSIPVQQSFPLDRAADAHEVSATGHVTGRLVVVVP